MWFQTLLGASGLAEDDVKEFGRDVNSLAFATATIARVRNFKASAIHHRISSIMFHSGVKHAESFRDLHESRHHHAAKEDERATGRKNLDLEGYN